MQVNDHMRAARRNFTLTTGIALGRMHRHPEELGDDDKSGDRMTPNGLRHVLLQTELQQEQQHHAHHQGFPWAATPTPGPTAPG